MSLVKVSFTSGEQADHSMILFVFILNKVTASMITPPFFCIVAGGGGDGKEVILLPEPWTGELIGRMHNAGVTYDDLAKEMNCTKSYISMLLNSRKKPDGIQERMEAAFERVLARR